jgi:beta-lactamase class D
MYRQDDYIKINQSIRKAEQFWVNNDFQSSTNEIIIFLKTIQDGNDKI